MAISFDQALGIHESALKFRTQRAEVLANNLANSDTPNYKARDLDFSAVLARQQAAGSQAAGLSTRVTDERHIATGSSLQGDPDLQYRTPAHPSLDQNTVDAHVEQAAYAENAIDFQASFTLLNSKFKGLISALRGE